MAMRKCRECGGKVSRKAKTCPHCGAAVGEKRIGTAAGCVVIIAFIGLLIVLGSRAGRPSPSKTSGPAGRSVSPRSQPRVALPTYRVVDTDKYDAPVKTQLTIEAVVSGRLTKEGLEALLDKLYREASGRRDFRYHGGRPTHVFIYLYTSDAHYKSGWGQWIAMLDRVGEDAEVQTRVRTELLSQIGAPPQVKLGLTEEKRKEVYRLLVEAEDRAQMEAERQYPLADPLKPGYSQSKVEEQLDKQLELNRTLQEKFKKDLARRYGLTNDQLAEIGVEAYKKNWPMPPLRAARDPLEKKVVVVEAKVPGEYSWSESGKELGTLTLYSDHSFEDLLGNKAPAHRWTITDEGLLITDSKCEWLFRPLSDNTLLGTCLGPGVLDKGRKAALTRTGVRP